MEFIVMTRDMLDQILTRLDQIEQDIREREAGLPEHLTVKEAMAFLKVSAKTLQNYRDRRVLDFIQYGRTILFPMDAILEFLNRNRIKARR